MAGGDCCVASSISQTLLIFEVERQEHINRQGTLPAVAEGLGMQVAVSD